jgi:hypothetical protein
LSRNHQYLQQCNEVNAEIENDHVWATDGPDAIMYGLEPNYGVAGDVLYIIALINHRLLHR